MFDAVDLDFLAHDPRALAGPELEVGLKCLARLRAALDACESRWLAAFRASGACAASGMPDEIAWLQARTGTSARDAAEKVRAAKLVAAVPEAGDALAAGDITGGHVDVLAKADSAVVSAHADELLTGARRLPVDQFDNFVKRFVQRHSPDDGAECAERQYRNRSAKCFVDDDGMTGVFARLDPVSGAVVTGALDRIAEELYRADPTLAPPTRRADALVEMARRSMAVNPDEARMPTPTVVVLVDHDRLIDELEQAGVPARLDNGEPVPAATARRLACEAGLLPMVLGGASRPLDLGRTRRLVSPAQRLALIARDGGCVFPGCDRPWRWCEAHHLIAFEHGGQTDLHNLGLLCVHHHHHVHEGGWTLEHLDDGGWRARAPNGTELDRSARASPALIRAG